MPVRHFWRDQRGLSPIVETVIMMFLLVGVFGGFAAYALASHARAIVIAAADSAGRTAAIECGLADATWSSDAVAAARQALADGGLQLGPFVAGSQQPGAWFARVSCTQEATAEVDYNQFDLFPFLGPLLAGGPAGAWSIPVKSAVVFPVE